MRQIGECSIGKQRLFIFVMERST